MVDQIETFYRTVYSDAIALRGMTLQSVLKGTMNFEESRGEVLKLDDYDQPDITEVTTRVADNVEIQVPRARRNLAPRFWEHTEYFDRNDPVKLNSDIRPGSEYFMAVVGSFERKIDVLSIDAFDADATDDDGSPIPFGVDQTALDPTAGTTTAIGADTGANVDKILRTYAILEENRTQRNVPWHYVLHPNQREQLFGFTDDDRLLSGDFNVEKPLTSGMIGSYMGMTFHVTPDILEETIDAALGRYMFGYAQDAMTFSQKGTIEAHFDIIADKRHSLQVAHYATFSATRRIEGKIVRVGAHSAPV